jgi:hypothetical protein
VSKSEDSRDATILGAAARAITDRSMAAVQSPDTLSAPPATALSALRHFLDGATLDQPRNVLGLSHFEAARLVDRLFASALATRGPGSDGRSRGAWPAAEITAARLSAIDELTAGLPVPERHGLVELAGRATAPPAAGRKTVPRLAARRYSGLVSALRCPRMNPNVTLLYSQCPTEA